MTERRVSLSKPEFDLTVLGGLKTIIHADCQGAIKTLKARERDATDGALLDIRNAMALIHAVSVITMPIVSGPGEKFKPIKCYPDRDIKLLNQAKELAHKHTVDITKDVDRIIRNITTIQTNPAYNHENADEF